LGKKSGREGDKVKESGLTPIFIDGATAFEEAKTIMVCRKMYVRDMKPQYYVKEEFIPSMYKDGVVHRVFTGEIIKIYIKKNHSIMHA